MGVFDSFYLLFKSDTTDAVKGVKDLELEVDKLTAKGKKRSDDENLQYVQKKKQLAERQKALKDEQKEAEEVGKAYVGIAQGIGGVITAYLGLNAAKTGLDNAQKFTMGLQLQSQWLGINAKSLAAFDQAFQTFGGTEGEGISNLKAIHDYLVGKGFSASGLDQIRQLENLGNVFKGLGIDQAELQGKSIGLSDDLILFLRNSPADKIHELVEQMKALNGVTDEGDKISADYNAQMRQTEAAVGGVWIKMHDQLYPMFTDFLKLVEELTRLHPFDALNGALGLDPDSDEFGTPDTPEAKARREAKGRPPAGSSAAQQPLSRSQQTIDYFVAQGYTPAQAQGIAANLQAESGLDSGARGDGGSAVGIAQWHQDRVASILAGTGIDVRTASYEDQLRAVAWELHQRGDDTRIKGAKSAGESAEIGSLFYERPGGGYAEAHKRAQIAIGLGQQALNTASSSPLNAAGNSYTGGSNSNVQISNITVHTQATDAPGIARDIGTALKSQLRNTISNVDDGVLA